MPESSTRTPHSESSLQSFIADFLRSNRNGRNSWLNPLSSVEILLEDAHKRRRLTAKKVTTGYKFIRRGTTIGGFDAGMTTLVSHQALRASRAPQAMRQYLAASDIPALPADTFHVSQFSAAEKSLPKDGSQVVVRPASLRARSDAISIVAERETFLGAWETAVRASLSLKPLERFIELQQYRPGLNIRVYVVGEKMVAAFVRVPIHVVGDGQSSVRDLIDDELAEWESCHYLASRKPTASTVLTKTNLTEHHVIPLDAIEMLSPSQDPKSGDGLTIDVTEHLNQELSNLAVETMWAFPGLGATAVDLLASGLDDTTGAVTVGIDPAADFTEFIYPTFGKSQRVTLDILDHMISNTK